MKRTKLDNKGFSLVELIIVIAIMAILAAALAPQLMKYIEKSRKSTDESTCGTIESAINTALSDEDIYKEVVGGSGITLEITDGKNMSATSGTATELIKELKDSIGTVKAPKESDKTKYKVTITVTDNKVGSVTCITE